MSSWYQIDVDESWYSAGRLHRLCRRFQHAYIHAGAPAAMAMFAQCQGRKACRRLYLSPEAYDYASDLLDDFSARPCDVPSSERLTLLYGPPGAAETLLPASPSAGLTCN